MMELTDHMAILFTFLNIIVVHRDFANLHSHQLCVSVPFSPYHHQHYISTYIYYIYGIYNYPSNRSEAIFAGVLIYIFSDGYQCSAFSHIVHFHFLLLRIAYPDFFYFQTRLALFSHIQTRLIFHCELF